MKKLYKYQKINHYTISALKQRSLWAAMPSSFNDPFEFRLKDIMIDNESSCKGIEEIREMNPSYVDYSDSELAQLIKLELQKYINNFGIICFSETDENMLMWSHYADNHFGICLGFEFNDTNDSGVYKVNYESSYPELNLKNIWHKEGMAKIFFTKSLDWHYELEWRLISITSNNLRKYPAKLTEVIFGCRTTSENEKLIMGILKNEDISYSYAELDDELYKVKIIR